MRINDILIEPVMTEKATDQATRQVYMFYVAADANKNQVKEALERLFKVKVASVTVSVRKGKSRRVGRRMITKQMPDRKIAYITVSEGKIDLFPSA